MMAEIVDHRNDRRRGRETFCVPHICIFFLIYVTRGIVLLIPQVSQIDVIIIISQDFPTGSKEFIDQFSDYRTR